MTDQDWTRVEDMIKAAVKETVNGKIFTLDKKLDAHMLEIKPYLQGAQGVRVIGGLLKWVLGLGVAWFAFVTYFK